MDNWHLSVTISYKFDKINDKIGVWSFTRNLIKSFSLNLDDSQIFKIVSRIKQDNNMNEIFPRGVEVKIPSNAFQILILLHLDIKINTTDVILVEPQAMLLDKKLTQKENITNAINILIKTKFGKNSEDKRIVTELMIMHRESQILVTELGYPNDYGGGALADYSKRTNDNPPKIQIDDSIPVAAYPGRLVHEGKHHIDDLDLLPYDLSSERRAFDIAYEVDIKLNSPIVQKYTDQQLEELYPYKSWPKAAKKYE